MFKKKKKEKVKLLALLARALESFSCTPDMETLYQWGNSTHGTFPSLISLHSACHFFFFLCVLANPRKPYVRRFPTQRQTSRLCSSTMNNLSQTNIFLRAARNLCVWNACARMLCLFSLYSLFSSVKVCRPYGLTLMPALSCSLTLIWTQTSTHPPTHAH